MPTPKQHTDKQPNSSIGYAMLFMDNLKLLIPQEQIKALETAKDMEISRANDQVAGYLQFENRSWPIFCFNNKLALLTSDYLNRRFCILLQTDSDSFGILSEQTLLIDSGEIHPQPLPESMLTTESPISALAIYADEVTCISSAERLAELLPLNAASKNE